MRTLRASGWAWMVLLAASTARASSTYSFDQSTYQVVPGGTVQVPVYLQIDGAEFTKLQLGNGLVSAGVDLFRSSGSAGVLSAADVLTNAADFNELITAPPGSVSPKITWTSAGDVSLLENVDLLTATTGVMGTVSGSSARIYVGSFKITVGNVLGQSTTFLAKSYATAAVVTFGSGINSIDNIYALDPPAAASVTITVPMPLPPAAWAGAGLLAAMAGYARLRRHA